MAHSIPYFLKLYKFPFLMGAALLISGTYVYTQIQMPAVAPLPPCSQRAGYITKKENC